MRRDRINTIVPIGNGLCRVIVRSEKLARELTRIPGVQLRAADAAELGLALIPDVTVDDERNLPAAAGFDHGAGDRIVEEGFDDLDAPPTVHADRDVPTPFSPPLEEAVLPQPDTIVREIRKLV